MVWLLASRGAGACAGLAESCLAAGGRGGDARSGAATRSGPLTSACGGWLGSAWLSGDRLGVGWLGAAAGPAEGSVLGVAGLLAADGSTAAGGGLVASLAESVVEAECGISSGCWWSAVSWFGAGAAGWVAACWGCAIAIDDWADGAGGGGAEIGWVGAEIC